MPAVRPWIERLAGKEGLGIIFFWVKTHLTGELLRQSWRRNRNKEARQDCSHANGDRLFSPSLATDSNRAVRTWRKTIVGVWRLGRTFGVNHNVVNPLEGGTRAHCCAKNLGRLREVEGEILL